MFNCYSVPAQSICLYDNSCLLSWSASEHVSAAMGRNHRAISVDRATWSDVTLTSLRRCGGYEACAIWVTWSRERYLKASSFFKLLWMASRLVARLLYIEQEVRRFVQHIGSLPFRSENVKLWSCKWSWLLAWSWVIWATRTWRRRHQRRRRRPAIRSKTCSMASSLKPPGMDTG
jgi:hypothetical protein